MRRLKNIVTIIVCICFLLMAVPLTVRAVENDLLTVEWMRTTYTGSFSGAYDDEVLNVDKDGNVYVANMDGYLYCYTPQKMLKWKVNLEQPGGSSLGVGPAFDKEGNCYIASLNKKVYKIDSQGRVLKEFLMEGPVAPSTSPVLGDDGTLYVVTQNQVIYALDKEDLQEKWHYRVNGAFGCLTPVLYKDTVYVGSDNTISALDTSINAEQREKWFYNLGDQLLYQFTRDYTPHEKRITVDAEGNLYFITTHITKRDFYRNKLQALKADGTEILWEQDILRYCSAPIVKGETIYYQTSDNYLHAHNIADGSEKWTKKIPDEVIGSVVTRAPQIGNDNIIYAAFGFSVYALEDRGEEAEILASCFAHSRVATLSQPGPQGELYVLQGNSQYNNYQRNLLKIENGLYQQKPRVLIIEDGEKEFSMLVGGQYEPKINLLDVNQEFMNTSGLSFRSENPEIISVEQGVFKAHKTGETQIYITHPANENIQGVIKINVLPQLSKASLKLETKDQQITYGQTIKLNVVLLTENNTIIKGEPLEWHSSLPLIASVDQSGAVTGKKAGITKVSVRLKNYLQIATAINISVADPVVEKVTLQGPGGLMEKTARTVSWYKKQGAPGTDWAAFGLNAVGVDLSELTTNGQTYLKRLELKLRENPNLLSLMTDYERTALGVISAGGDPTNFAGTNLMEKIYNYPSLNQGVNCAIWGLIALDAVNASVPLDAKYDREYFIRYILNNRVKEGWSFGGSEPDPDMTGMALYALAPYKDRPAVRAAGEQAIKWLSKNQDEDGIMKSWGTKNSESCAQTIMGITAWGIDPQGDLFTKKRGNLVTGFLTFYVDNGMFKHTDTPDPAIATDQGLEALAALQDFYKNGRSTIFYKISSKASGEEINTLEIFPKGIEIEANKSIKLVAQDQIGRLVDNEKVHWSVSSPDIAEIDEQGKLVSKKPGEVIVSLTLKDKPAIRDESRLRVIGQDFIINEAEIQDNLFANNKIIALNVKNISDNSKSALFIINLFNKETGELVYSSYMTKDFAPQETSLITGAVQVPEEGEYLTKVMLWNNWEKMRPLVEAREVEKNVL